MGRDNQPKARQLARKDKKEARRASYARILIVTEGGCKWTLFGLCRHSCSAPQSTSLGQTTADQRRTRLRGSFHGL